MPTILMAAHNTQNQVLDSSAEFTLHCHGTHEHVHYAKQIDSSSFWIIQQLYIIQYVCIYIYMSAISENGLLGCFKRCKEKQLSPFQLALHDLLPPQQVQCFGGQAQPTVCSDRTQTDSFVGGGWIAVANCHSAGAECCAGSGVHRSSSSSGTTGAFPHVTPAKMSASFYVDVRKYKAHLFQVMLPLRCPDQQELWFRFVSNLILFLF